MPKTRHRYEKQDQKNENMSVKQRKHSALENASERSVLKSSLDGSVMLSSRWMQGGPAGQVVGVPPEDTRLTGESSPNWDLATLRSSPGRSHNDIHLVGPNLDLIFLQQYRKFQMTRQQLEDEGFWDSQENRYKSSEEQFGFEQLEQDLARAQEPPQPQGEEEVSTVETQQENSDSEDKKKSKRQVKSGKRVVISTLPPTSIILTDSEDTGIDSSSATSRVSTHDDISSKYRSSGKSSDSRISSVDPDATSYSGRPTPPGLEPGLTPTSTNPDLMARFYARLQELKDSKEEEDRGTNASSTAASNKDRRRVKTALRRLLADRLFPEDAEAKRSKKSSVVGSQGKQGYQSGSEDLTSGSISPFTLGSRSKTTMSVRSKFPEDMSTRPSTRGKTTFVGLESSPSTSDVNKQPSPRHVIGSQRNTTQSVDEENLPYYGRHPLAELRRGQVSRLYSRPVTQQQGRSSRFQSSDRAQGHQGDGNPMRWSVPGDRRTDANQSDSESQQKNSSQGTWRRQKSDISWAYNMQNSQGQGTRPATDQNLKSLDDWHLRKLLEELYRDKKYMDKLIDSTDSNKTEEEICNQLEDGREYLMQRAQFWRNKGPLPPRPPTTELGWRMQRAQTAPQAPDSLVSPLPDTTTPPEQAKLAGDQTGNTHNDSDPSSHGQDNNNNNNNNNNNTNNNNEGNDQDDGKTQTEPLGADSDEVNKPRESVDTCPTGGDSSQPGPAT